MGRSWSVLRGLCTFWLMAIFLTACTISWAGPAGIIADAAFRTPVGRIITGLLAVLLSPFIIYYMIKHAKQVRRTREDLSRLTALHPQYRWLDVKDRAMATFTWVWSAWGKQKMDAAAAYTTSWYMQNQQMLLDDWTDRGVENVCRLNSIKRVEPLFVQHNESNEGKGSRMVVGIAAKVVDYLIDKSTGKILEGSKKVTDLTTIWTFVWEDGAWMLNLIEPQTMEWEYLLLPNELPASLAPEPSASG